MSKALVSVFSALIVFAGAAQADDDVWDPSQDRGVPEQQLFDAADAGREVPGAQPASRKPVRGEEAQSAPAAAPAVAPAPAPQPDSVEMARPAGIRARTTAPAREAQYGSRRIQLFLVPMGTASSLAAGPAQLALEAEVRKLPGVRPVDLVEELAVPPPAEDQARMAEAQRLVGEGSRLLVAHRYEEAVGQLQKAVEAMEDAGLALDPLNYADLHARLGVALAYTGEDEASRAAFRQAARVDPADAVNGSLIDRKMGPRLELAREAVATGPTGVLSVVTEPAGSQVFLAGVYKGLTPLSIQKVPVGLNLLRIDRPGAYPVVQLVEAKPAVDVSVKARMAFTPETLELQRTLAQLPRALDRGAAVPDMVKALGSRFRLERAVVATVAMARSNEAEVRLCLFDFARGTRLADARQRFIVDAEGGLEAAVAAWARGVFDRADRSRDRAAWDPLDRSDGTEAWYSTSAARERQLEAQEDDEDLPEWERRGTYQPKSSRKEGVRSADPLNHSDGTEDW